MDSLDKDYRCEDCKKFDETEIPADCKAGHGKVAFRHRACPDFVLKLIPTAVNENERKDQNENALFDICIVAYTGKSFS